MVLSASNRNYLIQIVDLSGLCQLIFHRVTITFVELFLLRQLPLNLPEVFDAELAFADVTPAIDMAGGGQRQTVIHTAGYLSDLQAGERLNLHGPAECLLVCLLVAFATG